MEYNDIIKRIKEQKPVLDDPENLTLSIMGKIEQLPIRKQRKIFRITGILSGAAACMLACIFVYETFLMDVHENKVDTKAFAYTENLIQRYDIQDKQDFLMLTNRKSEDRRRKEQKIKRFETLK